MVLPSPHRDKQEEVCDIDRVLSTIYNKLTDLFTCLLTYLHVNKIKNFDEIFFTSMRIVII